MADTGMADEPRERSSEWLDVADEVIEESLARHEELAFTAEELEVAVPIAFGPDAPRATWRFDGTVRIHTEGASGPLFDWLRWWQRRTPDD